MSVKIACISDTHGNGRHRRLNIPECDILIHAGDFSNIGEKYDVIDFLDWLSWQYQATHKIIIAGNHDLSFDPERCSVGILPNWLGEALERYTNITYLFHQSIQLFGLNIFGSPYTPDFYPEHWAFNKPRGNTIREYWKMIPSNTDILITHGPAKGINDRVWDGDHVGCLDLKDRIYQLPQLKLHVVGHIHDNTNYRNAVMKEIHVGDHQVKCVNASVVDDGYIVRNQPQIITLDI